MERAGGLQPCGLPQPLRFRQRIEVELLPPYALVAALMEFTVVSTAELENAGVELIEENGGGLGARLKQRLELIDRPGVRLRKSEKEKPGK